jgi:hypothetical protein
MKNHNRKEHSIIGRNSCIVAIIALLYVLLLSRETTLKFLKDTLNMIFPEARGENGSALWIFLLTIILFFIIPIGAHVIGLILGFVGIFEKTKDRLFAGIGLTINLLFPVAYVIVIYLSMSNRK